MAEELIPDPPALPDGPRTAAISPLGAAGGDLQSLDRAIAAVPGLRRAWIAARSSDRSTQLALEERARRLGADLAAEGASPLEVLVIERIIICSLQVEVAETQYLAAVKAGAPIKKVQFCEDAIDRAHRRYLGAIKALSQLRRLQAPLLAQVNVGMNQVNLAPPAPPHH